MQTAPALDASFADAWCRLLGTAAAQEWRAQACALTQVSAELSPPQRVALAQLHQLGIMRTLLPFGPLLAGTFPLDLAGPGSDLDILIGVADTAQLLAIEQLCQQQFSKQLHFDIRFLALNGVQSLVCRFTGSPFPVEIVAQPVAAHRQRAWQHLQAEARLLLSAGCNAAAAIRERRRAGMKTEPAFADVFRLPGDPYAALDQLALAPGAELKAVAQAFRRR